VREHSGEGAQQRSIAATNIQQRPSFRDWPALGERVKDADGPWRGPVVGIKNELLRTACLVIDVV
jgi:hypothetical protein